MNKYLPIILLIAGGVIICGLGIVDLLIMNDQVEYELQPGKLMLLHVGEVALIAGMVWIVALRARK